MATTPQTWTTAYLAALADPDETPAFAPQPKAFSAQTVRQRVRLRRGGTAVRLVLSNEFGRVPLVIDRVTVSTGNSPGLAVPHRDGTRWEIAPGGTAASDPVPLSAGAGDELVVTCYVSGAADPSAFLHSAQRTGEVAPGDQSDRRRLTGAEQFTSLYWISRVLTDEPGAGPVIVTLGDSITRGDATTVDLDQRYPDHLQRRLQAAERDGAAGLNGAVVLNAGLGANRLLSPVVGPSMVDRFARDVLSIAEATHVIIMGGINDIAMSSVFGGRQATAEEITVALFALARRARDRGVQAVLGTITPMLASRYDSFRADGNEDVRQAVNRALEDQKDWPLADFAASVADPADPTRIAPAFDSGDGVHPGDAGARALAGAVVLTTLTFRPR